MFFLPYNVDVATPRLPVANWVLIGLTVVLSTALLIEDSPYLDEPSERARLEESREGFGEQGFSARGEEPPHALFDLLVLQPGKYFRVTQVVGHLFAHADYVHLAGNMIFLFCFGNAVNAKFGHMRFVLLYLVVGVFNALVFLGMGVGGIGASAAIWGLAGAFVVLYPKNVVEVWYFVIFDWGTTEISSLLLVGFYFAFEVLGLFVQPDLVMSHLGHVVGGCWGFAATVILVKTGVVRSTEKEENLLEALHLD